jgi:hypothetical protein
MTFFDFLSSLFGIPDMPGMYAEKNLRFALNKELRSVGTSPVMEMPAFLADLSKQLALTIELSGFAKTRETSEHGLPAELPQLLLCPSVL